MCMHFMYALVYMYICDVYYNKIIKDSKRIW